MVLGFLVLHAYLKVYTTALLSLKVLLGTERKVNFLTWLLLVALQRLHGRLRGITEGLPQLSVLLALLLGRALLLELTVLQLVIQLDVAGFQELAEARLLLLVLFCGLV